MLVIGTACLSTVSGMFSLFFHLQTIFLDEFNYIIIKSGEFYTGRVILCFYVLNQMKYTSR